VRLGGFVPATDGSQAEYICGQPPLLGPFVLVAARCAHSLLRIEKMFSSLFWLWPTVFRSIEPDEPLDLSSYQNASAIDSLVSQLQAELVPPPLAVSYPMKTFHPPPQAGKDFSLNPAAVLGSRQTSSCTGGADNYCFAANPGSYCPNCGTCCTQASGGWCCASTGAFCCATAVDGTSGGCCVTGAICDSNGCSLPVYVASLARRWT
jgi:hypothetical protein